jgi:hypothetical protein
MAADLDLCTNCDLRARRDQCGLSDQEVTAQPVPGHIATATRGSAVVIATQRRAAGKDSGGRL